MHPQSSLLPPTWHHCRPFRCSFQTPVSCALLETTWHLASRGCGPHSVCSCSADRYCYDSGDGSTPGESLLTAQHAVALTARSSAVAPSSRNIADDGFLAVSPAPRLDSQRGTPSPIWPTSDAELATLPHASATTAPTVAESGRTRPSTKRAVIVASSMPLADPIVEVLLGPYAPRAWALALLDPFAVIVLGLLEGLYARPTTSTDLIVKSGVGATLICALLLAVLLVRPYARGHEWKAPVRAALLLLALVCVLANFATGLTQLGMGAAMWPSVSASFVLGAACLAPAVLLGAWGAHVASINLATHAATGGEQQQVLAVAQTPQAISFTNALDIATPVPAAAAHESVQEEARPTLIVDPAAQATAHPAAAPLRESPDPVPPQAVAPDPAAPLRAPVKPASGSGLVPPRGLGRAPSTRLLTSATAAAAPAAGRSTTPAPVAADPAAALTPLGRSPADALPLRPPPRHIPVVRGHRWPGLPVARVAQPAAPRRAPRGAACRRMRRKGASSQA